MRIAFSISAALLLAVIGLQPAQAQSARELLNQAIAADDPGNDSAGRWVAQDFIAMGVALALAGDLPSALRSQRQGLAILEAGPRTDFGSRPPTLYSLPFQLTAPRW